MTATLPVDRSRIWSDNGVDSVVTLLAGVQEPDRILVAADSLQVWQQQGYGESIAKLQKIPGQDLVYAIYGEGTYDLQFRDFLVQKKFSDWSQLEYETPYLVKRLDLESAPHGFAAIVAGRLEDNIVRLLPFGRFTLPASGSAQFIGQNRLAAKVAWDAAASLASSVDIETRFATVMETVVSASPPMLGPPVHMWRVTPDRGCEQVLPVGSA
jgi:hypothetical protein